MAHSNLSSKACQPKDVSTKADLPVKSGTFVQTSTPTKVVSCIPHVSAENNVGYFKNTRRECQINSFDGLRPFSYVCRMIRFSEPNTSEVEHADTRDFSRRRRASNHLLKSVVLRTNSIAFGVDEPEHVLGFQLRLIWIKKAGGKTITFLLKVMTTFWEKHMLMMGVMNPPHHLSLMGPTGNGRLRDQGTSLRMVPGRGDSNDPEDPDDDPDGGYVPGLEGNMLYQHECPGHWPYDKGCDACVQACGKTPARRRKHKENQQTIGLAADYTFIAGRHWRLRVMLMLHTGMMGIVLVTGNRENDVKPIASVFNEIGVGGLNVEVATDNERYLVDMTSRGLSRSNARLSLSLANHLRVPTSSKRR